MIDRLLTLTATFVCGVAVGAAIALVVGYLLCDAHWRAAIGNLLGE